MQLTHKQTSYLRRIKFVRISTIELRFKWNVDIDIELQLTSKPSRKETTSTLVFYFTKLATSREHYICLLFISSSSRILYFQPATLTASESPNYLSLWL